MPLRILWYGVMVLVHRNLRQVRANPKKASERGIVPFYSADCAKWDSPRRFSDSQLVSFFASLAGLAWDSFCEEDEPHAKAQREIK